MICDDSFYFTPGYMLGDWFIFSPQLRYPLIHMEKLRRWQKISSLTSLKIQTWQLWYWGWYWVPLSLFLKVLTFQLLIYFCCYFESISQMLFIQFTSWSLVFVVFEVFLKCPFFSFWTHCRRWGFEFNW